MKLRHMLWAATAVLWCVPSAAAGLDLHRPTTVATGRHEILHLEKVRSARVGNASLAEVKVLNPNEILLTGLVRGETTLTVGRQGEPDVVYPLAVVDHTTPTDNELITLGVGLQKTMAAEGVKRIAVGNPQIANVQMVSNKELLLTGVAEGRTSLIVWFSDEKRVSYAVKVATKSIEEVLTEIKQVLGPIEGVTLRVVGDKIILETSDEMESVDDANRVKKICKLYEQSMTCL
jgi:Flp pilus assembly secretin CpaC